MNHNRHKHQKKSPFQKIIITVIILTIITVITAIVCAFVFDKKYQVEMKISQLSSKYYENHFFLKNTSDESTSEILEHFKKDGFAKVSLRQLILADQNITNSEINLLRKYCNEDTTYVQFFPEPPYDKKSYHTEYTYSCSF